MTAQVMGAPFDMNAAYRIATTSSMAADALYRSFAANVSAAGDVRPPNREPCGTRAAVGRSARALPMRR